MPENREDFPVDAETAWRQCDEERRELLIANDGLAKERDEAHKTILALERGYREVSAALQATQVAEKYDRFARKLDELAALPEGWDSYGATRITPAAVEAVRGLLSVLAIVPCSSGGLQVEFHALGWDFELEVEADGSVASVICEERTGARTAPATPSAGPALGALVALTCANCGKLPTCLGAYEGATDETFACDDCCAHGCEDGQCRPLAVVLADLRADTLRLREERDEARAERNARARDVMHLESDLRDARAAAQGLREALGWIVPNWPGCERETCGSPQIGCDCETCTRWAQARRALAPSPPAPSGELGGEIRAAIRQWVRDRFGCADGFLTEECHVDNIDLDALQLALERVLRS